MKTTQTILLWLSAFVLTMGLAAYQEKTGPTYPISGEAQLEQTSFHYSLQRTHGGETDHRVELEIADSAVTGLVIWKRYKLDELTKMLLMKRQGKTLFADLPHQPPAGKLEYQVVLLRNQQELTLPADEPAVIRFKGAVPNIALIPHVFLMFGGLLLAMRTALGAVFNRNIRTLSWVTTGLIIVGGLIFGPIVQKYAFGAYWTGWPFGGDWTDNKTAIMALAWLAVLWTIRGKTGEHRGRWWAVAAMIVTFAVYLIPHSMRGSELDYSTISPDSMEVSSGESESSLE